ncbi:MAG: F0F1 ATP synthase subunit A [Clostridiales bacterium]|nr:F0F1 ATP synthase subunit A [Clostridiales bacterium]
MMTMLLSQSKTLGEVMKEGVLPADINFFGLGVNPSFYSALIVTAFLLFIGVILRIFVIPKFKVIPGKFQVVLEWIVSFFAGLAKDNSPKHNNYLGAYCFSAGLFIFFGTLIELLGLRAVLVDINACIMLGMFSFISILLGGLRYNGPKGLLGALKDFSLPLSMSFRLFGSMLSGVLVTLLVYEYIALSFVVPVFVAVVFTLLHAVIQTYVLTMLTSMFYGQAVEPKERKVKKSKQSKRALSQTVQTQ